MLKRLRTKHILILILLLTLLFRIYRLDFPKGYVFDEVYHAFTAKEYVLGHEQAWEWWTKPPPGVAYEWTHPPLAKEIMAASLYSSQTMQGWAWRLPGVVLGVLAVYLVYQLTLSLLKNQTTALMAAFLFSIDGLNFVQSRTGMNDIYEVSFMLGSLVLLFRKKYFYSSIVLGLSLASKWAAFYTYLIILPVLLKERSFKQIFYYLLIPPLIYLLSYVPFFLSGHNLDQFIELQRQMWWYHTHLKATHNYSSPFWSWPLNLYPVWYYVEYQKDSMANIFASGNPAVFWSGAVAIILTIIDTIKHKSQSLFIILLGYLAFWLPWAISPRIMFLYHYSPSVPFFTMALAYQLNQGLEHRDNKKAVIIFLVVALISFLLIYPFLTGIFLPRDFAKFFFLTNLAKNPF